MHTASVTPLVPRQQTPTLAEACAALETAKAVEQAATAERLAAEEAVLALIGELPEEGTTKREAGGFKIAITTSIRRSVDADALAAVAQSGRIPEAIGKRLIRWKPELVTREMRYVQANEPAIYAAVAECTTAKPGKPAVKVERIDGPTGEAA